MSSTTRMSFAEAVQCLNRIFWLASIGLWIWIVSRSQIWSAGLMSDIFWINFLIFLAAGLGALATTHFVASALPLCLGVMALTTDHGKAIWAFTSLYLMTAIVIGFFAAGIKFLFYLDNRLSAPTDRDCQRH
jgi:hypothetical protein